MVCLLAALTLRSQTRRGVEQIAPASQQESNGKYYALVVGINKYPTPLPPLKTAVGDAQAMANLLREQYGFQVTALLDQEATRDNILKAMTRFRKSLAANDNLLIYYAGHGSFDREASKGYWLPVDADPDPLDTSHDISADDITNEIRAFAARHVLVVSDSCFSGDLSRAAETISPSDGNEAYIRRMLRAPSRTIMASGSDEPVSDSGSEGHSVFAALLLVAMRNRNESSFTADDLFVSIRKSVLTRSGQSPQYTALRNSVRGSASLDNGDFVFTRIEAPALAPPTLAPPPNYVSAAPYLAKYGISVENVTPGTYVGLVRPLGYMPDRASLKLKPLLPASGVVNVLMQDGQASDGKDTCNEVEVVSYSLRFSPPLKEFTFTRAILPAENVNGITHPAWQAQAFDPNGKEIPQHKFIGEQLIRYLPPQPANTGAVPAAQFQMEGPYIASVTFTSSNRLHGRPFAAFCSVQISNMGLMRADGQGLQSVAW